jgi:hypothetical protein
MTTKWSGGIHGGSLRIDGQPHEHDLFHRCRHCVVGAYQAAPNISLSPNRLNS